MIRLDILSDPICPWCYIGKSNLDSALARILEHPLLIEWHPFQLNPEMPREGADRRSYLDAKFGGRDKAASAYARVATAAAGAGLQIDFDRMDRVPNTLDAHRLIHWAGIEQAQGPVVDALFRAYFTEGRDIGNRDVLCDIADTAGMDAALVGRLLASDADEDAIRARDAHSRQMGVTAVPTYIVDQRHAVPGAQPPEFWEQVIAELTDQDKALSA